MQIGILTSAQLPPREGIGYYVLNSALEMAKKGHKIKIFTRGGFSYRRIQYNNNISIYYIPFIPVYPIYLEIHLRSLEKAISEISHMLDALQIHMPLVPIPRMSIPKLVTFHTPMLADAKAIQEKGIRPFLIKKASRAISYPLEYRALQRSDMVSSVSSSVKRELKLLYGFNKQIFLLHNAVNPQEFIFVPSYSRRENIVLFVGRLTYRKGIFDLINAAAEVCASQPSTKFIFVGSGPLFQDMWRLAEKLKLTRNVRFTGHCDRTALKKLYSLATVLVMPSHYEGMPTVLLEAMSSGIPTVAATARGITEVIQHEQNGVLVPPRNPGLLAKTILSVLEDSVLRQRLGEAARQTVINRYTWPKTTMKIIECLKRIQS